MGTRNLTIIKIKNKTKLCQYGQWDGYPTGQGQTIADFLKEADLPKFKEQVEALKVWTNKAIEQAYIDAGAKKDERSVTMQVSGKVRKEHPELSRDYGAQILKLIHDGVVTRVQLYNESYKDDSSCEYWYEINLDDEIVTMNGEPYTFKQWTRKGFMEKLEEDDN